MRGRGEEQAGERAGADVRPVVGELRPQPVQVDRRSLREHHELRDRRDLLVQRELDGLGAGSESARGLLADRGDAGVGLLEQPRDEADAADLAVLLERRPAMISSARRHSSAVRASGPTVSRLHAAGKTPSLGTSPHVGRWPVTPQSAAGIRTEPAVSVPSASVDEPGRDRRAAAAARAAGHARRIPRVAAPGRSAGCWSARRTRTRACSACRRSSRRPRAGARRTRRRGRARGGAPSTPRSSACPRRRSRP